MSERSKLWSLIRESHVRSTSEWLRRWRSKRDILRRRLSSSKKKQENFAKDAIRLSKAQASADERNRRQEEILKETRELAASGFKKNQKLLIKCAKLQKWTECMDDDEVRKIMNQLYLDLEDWIRRHFPYDNPSKEKLIDIPNTSPGYYLQTLHEIHSEVYSSIFYFFLRKDLVESGDEYFSRAFSGLSEEISTNCKSLCPSANTVSC